MVEVNVNKLAEVARNELVNDFGLKTLVDVGDDFFNALWYGTLKTLMERVDRGGFCHTSYGEENGVKCYGHTHYPRDTAEAARVLADVGLTEPALRVLDFTRVSVKNAPVVHNQSISYELIRDERQTSIHLHQNVSFPLQVTAGIPASKEKINLSVNDQPFSKADLRRQNQVQWISADLPGDGKIHWKLSLT